MANTVTTTSQSAPWSAPYLQNFWNGAFQTANRPYQSYQGPQVAGMSDIQSGALGGIQGAMYGNPTTWAGMNQLGSIIGNQGNPNLDQVTNTIKADAGHAFDQQIGQLNDQFSNPNSFGTARHALGAEQLTQDASRGLGQALGNLQYGQYNTGLDRSMGAANQAQSMTNSQTQNMMAALQAGSVPQQTQQRMYDQGQQNFNNWWQYPQQQSQFLQGALGLGGGYGSQTQTSPGPNAASQVLGGGLLAAGALGQSGALGNNGWLSGLFSSGSGNGFTGYGPDGSYIYG